MADGVPGVSIVLLLLANHVEAVNGLLYMSGGGWTDHRRAVPRGGQPPPTHLGIGLGVAIPWHETNQPHEITIQIENDDATLTVARVEAQFNVGRPPNLPPGSEQHVMMGLPLDVVFPDAGGYRVVAQLDGDGEVKTWAFRVHDVAAPSEET
ncbi:MAG: hypothetical protein IVW57_07655 [Ktedonobacterales bacterium]|nr:hypothetical protein [Ktedonobacterales bacterium]